MSNETKPAPTGLFGKLAEVMKEVGRVQKSGYNTHFKYHYVKEEDLIDAVRESLVKRGVLLIPSTINSGVDGDVTTAVMEFTFIDSESGEQFKAQWQGAGQDKGDKGIYKAYTGALKYFLMKTFLISTGDDPEAASEPSPRKSASGPKAVTTQGDPNAQHKALDTQIAALLKALNKSDADLDKHVAATYETDSTWKDLSVEYKTEVVTLLKETMKDAAKKKAS